MRVQALLAVILLGAVMFAGCSSGGSDDPSPSATGSSSKSGTSTGSQTNSTGSGNQTGNATNQAPLANLTASTLNGTSAINVTFNITASDPDGDALNWTLAFGDNSTESGANATASVVHRYNVTGNFTAVLTVTDARGLNATANVTIRVTISAGGAASGKVVFPLATDAPCPDCYALPVHSKVCGDFTSGQGRGTRCDWVALVAAHAGLPFLLTGGSDPGIEFFSSCTGSSATSVKWQDATAATETGVVPAGALCVVVYEFEEPDNAFVLTLG